MKRPGQINSHSLTILILNVLLLICAATLYGRYTSVYQERLREENLGNIANLNQSAASNATALIDSWSVKLEDIAKYIDRHGMSREEALAYLDDGNSSDERQFQLIGPDYTGHIARRDENGAFIPVSYTASAYAEMQRVFDQSGQAQNSGVRFTPEFTDGNTAIKHFAVCIHLTLQTEGGGSEICTLLLSTEARDVLAVFNNQNVFTGLSTVLMDETGQYIVSNTDFKSDNFYQYLYVYNDLSLDQRSQIQREIEDKGSGELYYKNAVGLDCVFRFSRMPANGWYCITCVPLSSFRVPVFNINYAIYAVLALLLMLGLDVFWLRNMNRTLKISMLREKEASEAKTDFLSRMSHDIRTPLNGIIGMTLLAMDEKNPPNTAEYLNNIKASVDFLFGLVNDILDMSKVESGKMELHPEAYTREEFCRYLQAVIFPLCMEKRQELRLVPPEDDAPALFDRLRVNQIFFNLLSNAVKYTPDGGKIEMRWTRTPLPKNRVAYDFTVRDNGIGMSEEFQRHMFESFSREHSDAAIPGSGLGLAIVWKLVELMGGSIRSESKEGEGTSFYVHLETAICPEERKEDSVEQVVKLDGKRALLCEDNQINALIAKSLLAKWGMESLVAVNGKIGVEMFREAEPGAFDIVLMDIRMPEMNGLDATRAIRSMERPDAKTIPIVAMTANAYDIDVQNCLEAGMNAHLGKPIQPELLQAQLIKLLIP